jgi:hypothetical protein
MVSVRRLVPSDPDPTGGAGVVVAQGDPGFEEAIAIRQTLRRTVAFSLSAPVIDR